MASLDHIDFWVLTAAAGATVEIDVLFDHSLGDIDISLRKYSDPNGDTGNGAPTLAEGVSGTDDEYITWTNTSSDSGTDIFLEFNRYDDPFHQACNGYDLVVRNIGLCSQNVQTERFCDPMEINSIGESTILRAINFTPTNATSLQAGRGTTGQFGYFLVSPATNEPGVALGSGRFCLGSPFGRYNIDGPGGVLNSLGPAGKLHNQFSNGDPAAGNEGFFDAVFLAYGWVAKDSVGFDVALPTVAPRKQRWLALLEWVVAVLPLGVKNLSRAAQDGAEFVVNILTRCPCLCRYGRSPCP